MHTTEFCGVMANTSETIFFRAMWGADYKKIRKKAIFKGAAADNILRLTTGQRTALEYDALYYRLLTNWFLLMNRTVRCHI